MLINASLSAKRILVTGNTGFTGPWLVHALRKSGAVVGGFSLEPEFDFPESIRPKILGPETHYQAIGDVSDYNALYCAFREFAPDLVVHLAAQPIVSRAWESPLSSFRTNALGTANLLECVRQNPSVKGAVIVTTDKVYNNKGTGHPHSESDELLGLEPYAASKAAAEMIVEGYRAYPQLSDKIAVARGGNIIGGGDWSRDRLVPDFVRAAIYNSPIRVRNIEAVRPWQHVLDLTGGYVNLLTQFAAGNGGLAAQNWNFGPPSDLRVPVRRVLEVLQESWKTVEIQSELASFKESPILMLDSGKAKKYLGWSPKLDVQNSISWTARWYKDFLSRPSSSGELIAAQYQDWLEL